MPCPRCGYTPSRPVITEKAKVLKVLKDDGRRTIYKGQDGSWWITYSGGQVTYAAVQCLIDDGKIWRTYSTSDESYGREPTLDMEATMAARKTGSRENIYLDPPYPT